MLGFNNTNALAAGGVAPETKAIMEIMKSTLEQYGSSLDLVVKTTGMLANINEIGEMSKVYVSYFPKNRPARSTFGVSGLAANTCVKIECIALIP